MTHNPTQSTGRVMTLLDGTEIREGSRVRAKGEDGRLRTCKVVEVLKGGGVDKVLLTAPTPFGTVIRSRYQVKKVTK